jgi:hypothetical protein
MSVQAQEIPFCSKFQNHPDYYAGTQKWVTIMGQERRLAVGKDSRYE